MADFKYGLPRLLFWPFSPLFFYVASFALVGNCFFETKSDFETIKWYRKGLRNGVTWMEVFSPADFSPWRSASLAISPSLQLLSLITDIFPLGKRTDGSCSNRKSRSLISFKSGRSTLKCYVTADMAPFFRFSLNT